MQGFSKLLQMTAQEERTHCSRGCHTSTNVTVGQLRPFLRLRPGWFANAGNQQRGQTWFQRQESPLDAV